MNQTTKELRILWSVDAFSESSDVQAQAGRAVRGLSEQLRARVQPVYVMPPPVSGIFPDAMVADALAASAHLNLDRLLEGLQLSSKAESPRILRAKSWDNGVLIETLLSHAREEKYDVIVVGTHSRKGVSRFLLGSFAETLLLQSPIPVLVASTKAKVLEMDKFSNVVFATDFSDASRYAFDRAIEVAKKLDAELTVFHHVDFLYPDLSFPFAVPPLSQTSIDEQVRSRRESAEKWAKEATAKGVKAKAHLSTAGGSTAEALVQLTGKLPSPLIAMNAHSSKLEALLLGSVARMVVRLAECPVLVIREAPGELVPARANDGMTHALLT